MKTDVSKEYLGAQSGKEFSLSTGYSMSVIKNTDHSGNNIWNQRYYCPDYLPCTQRFWSNGYSICKAATTFPL